MKKHIKSLIKRTFGIQLLANESFEKMEQYRPLAEEFSFISHYPKSASDYLIYRDKSKAQLKQDLFVLMELNFKRNGYFVEFGATDGESLSNTYLLEKNFSWRGILAEPGKIWHKSLQKNRNCHLETDCVWSTTGDNVNFKEVPLASLSTVEGYGESDNHSESRSFGKTYQVATISLNDLLDKHGAPKEIDYLSVDTEGTELLILEHFNFELYQIKIITVEHNYTPIRKGIHTLLTSKGYDRVHEEFSQFDDWYVLRE